VTLAILALLASLALPLAELSVQRARERELRHALRTLRTAIDAHKQAADDNRIARAADASGYPPTLEVLVEGVKDARDPKGARLYFLRRVPRDPFGGEWGLRSYASPPDEPAPGKDVFDVYSRREGAGLNGVPYREW
jgi:general secretion pathway protein G